MTNKKINEINGKILDLKTQRQIARRDASMTFKEKYRGIILLCDILVVLAICFNFGALMITDYLVTSSSYENAKNPNEIKFYEANKIQAKINNFETIEDADELTTTQKAKAQNSATRKLAIIFRQGILLSLYLLFYVYSRNHLYTRLNFFLLMFTVFLYFFILGFDFFHDLGIFLSYLRYH